MNYLKLIKKLAYRFLASFIILFSPLEFGRFTKVTLKHKKKKNFMLINRASIFSITSGVVQCFYWGRFDSQDKYFDNQLWMVNQDIKFIRHLFFRTID